jgi:hypothetical protein
MPIVNDSPETGAVRSEQQRAVTEALNTLPADQRALIEDAYFLGLTHAELAARFRMPLGTVKTRIPAGMMALRQQLQEVVANDERRSQDVVEFDDLVALAAGQAAEAGDAPRPEVKRAADGAPLRIRGASAGRVRISLREPG